MQNLIRDIDEAVAQGKFSHEGLNWIRSFKRNIQNIEDVAVIYKEVLRSIAELEGPLTGEDATCFQTWAQEALEVHTAKCTHPTGYIKSVRICGLCGEQLSG